MIGAIIGDIVGSRFEWDNHRSKDFELLTHKCFFTDDSVMSLAVCDALMRCKADYGDLSEQAVRSMQSVGRPYPHCGYGGSFQRWMYSDNPKPYNSYGNGAAMRVSGCGYVGRTIDEVKQLSRAVTEVTHNHPEGLKGAEATAVAVFLARTGTSLIEIQDYIIKNYYPLGFTLDSIRETYRFIRECHMGTAETVCRWQGQPTIQAVPRLPQGSGRFSRSCAGRGCHCPQNLHSVYGRADSGGHCKGADSGRNSDPIWKTTLADQHGGKHSPK